jgi:hypothetical protein
VKRDPKWFKYNIIQLTKEWDEILLLRSDEDLK